MQQSHGAKALVGALALTLLLSSCLIVGTNAAAAASGSGTSDGLHKGLRSEQYGKLQELQSRLRKQAIKHGKASLPIVEEASTILNMKPEELRASLQNGKSIAEIAAEKGITEKALTEKLIALRNAKIDEAVQAGKLTKERADEVKTRMKDHISYIIRQKGLSSGWFKSKPYHSKGIAPISPEKLAAIIGISKDQLIEEMKAGKSIAEIAQEKGMKKEELIAKIKEELTPFLEKAVERKPMLENRLKQQK